jgi:pimeloyl-ACP methyl ester carboxylesterase
MRGSLPAYTSIGAGPPVVALHCTLSSKNQWKALSGLLSSEYRVIAIDLYGYGETPLPTNKENFSLLDEAKLVQSLLDAVLSPGEPFHLVGHSYGGAVALCLCHLLSRQVKTLTVFEPVAFHLLEPEDPALEQVHSMMQQLAQFFSEGRAEEAAATFLDYWSGTGSFASFPQRVQRDFAQRTPKLELDFKAITGTELTLEDYRRLRLPVTVIAGRYSRLPALRVAQRVCETLPNCTLRWVATGHMGPVSNPELVNPIIKESLVPRKEEP